ncbi:hypothetical protein PXH69_24745 [Rhodococcus qingshengii]|uniref:Uncharacterized protein n=1 Tax=Rhodococcus qingshengii TaxID=334542 RepID=A0AAW6LT77_RHOSG|nr:hypothetical protein [Rhodococcus qingshengii]MDE8648180.1 hypothetical protein [Rhodococcus qingshengii]
MSDTEVLTMYGASDDLVEFEGAISEEFQAYDAWAGLLTAPNGETLIVRAEFGKDGSDSAWTLAVENTSTLAQWPVQFAVRPDHINNDDDDRDPAIRITVPTGTTITELSR